MKIIDIPTSSPYKVLLGRGILSSAGRLIRQYAAAGPEAETAVLVTDSKVGPLYADAVSASLTEAGFRIVTCVIPEGEGSKNLQSYTAVMELLAENRVTRSDLVVALGGGMTGDLAGFAAATYLRGIAFVQIPTTLLAAVDSSVGGKTGVDLRAGKNLAGAFHQPALVLCDPDTLDTLTQAVFAEGCAEVIKYAVLGDEKLFSHLERFHTDFDRAYVISRCIEMKRDIVVEDEFDTGRRQLLNLGHTLAHAAEKLSGFTLYHGMAVSIGMAVVLRAAAKEGTCSAECAGRVISLLSRFGLPVSCGYGIDVLYNIMQSDKKRRGGSISIVIPKRIGDCEIRKMPMDRMRRFMESGL